MKCEIEMDLECIKRPKPYKYFVLSKHGNDYENLDKALSIWHFNPHINRCLIIDKTAQIPGGKMTKFLC